MVNNMNNKGFTLIELILVIALLSLIGLISVPNVIKVINKNKVDDYNGTIDSIEKAASLYASDNRYELNFRDSSGGVSFCKPTDDDAKKIYADVKLETLINSKYISSPVKNFCTDEEISGDIIIKIILSCGTRQFSFDIDNEDVLKRRVVDGKPVEGIDGIKIEDDKYCDSLY